jgi:hypothetical protein
MCQIIDSEYIIVRELEKRDTCTMEDLISRKEIIESSFPEIFVDVSRNSVESSALSYSRYFSLEEDGISKSGKSFEKLHGLFESRISVSLRDKLNKVYQV